MHPPRILGLVASLAVLTACAPAASPVVTPTPTATVLMCVPEFGGDPYPCSTAEFDQMKLRDAEYSRAEAIYRRFFELEVEARKARVTTPSEETLSLLAEPLQDLVREAYQERKDVDETEFSIASIRRVPSEESAPERTLALLVCIQRKGGVNDTSALPGQAAPLKVIFIAGDGLRIWTMDQAEQASCG